MSLDLVAAISGHYAACCLSALHETGCLARLRQPVTAAKLAAETGVDPAPLGGVLDFVAATTSVLVRNSDTYQLADRYQAPHALEFQIDKFLGAYGPPIRALDRVLREPAVGAQLVAEKLLARAFAVVREPAPSLMAMLLRGWQVESLVDLGCGAGGLLIELATASPSFRGWGFDANPHMVSAAAEAASAAGVADQVEFRVADVRTIESGAVPADAKAADAIHARSLLNAVCAPGGAAVVQLLGRIRSAFGGRTFFVEDYYGRLGAGTPEPPAHTLLQDLAQLASGQGIPPPDLAGWAALYEQAGYGMLHAYEGTNDGISWFVHVCALPGTEQPVDQPAE